MISQQDICIVIFGIVCHMALTSPNITHTFVILNKEVFYHVSVSNAFGAILDNHSFPAIFLFSVNMLPKASLWRRCNPYLHIFIITMILSYTTNE